MSVGACFKYKENDASSETLGKFRTALQANRSGAASAWKSAVKLLKMASSRRPESYCFRSYRLLSPPKFCASVRFSFRLTSQERPDKVWVGTFNEQHAAQHGIHGAGHHV